MTNVNLHLDLQTTKWELYSNTVKNKNPSLILASLSPSINFSNLLSAKGEEVDLAFDFSSKIKNDLAVNVFKDDMEVLNLTTKSTITGGGFESVVKFSENPTKKDFGFIAPVIDKKYKIMLPKVDKEYFFYEIVD